MPSTLSIKGQVIIPKDIREALRMSKGDVVDFVLDNGEVKLKVFKKGQAKSIAGSFNKYSKANVNNEEIREEIKRKVAIDASKEGD